LTQKGAASWFHNVSNRTKRVARGRVVHKISMWLNKQNKLAFFIDRCPYDDNHSCLPLAPSKVSNFFKTWPNDFLRVLLFGVHSWKRVHGCYSNTHPPIDLHLYHAETHRDVLSIASSSLQMLVLNNNFIVLGFDMAVWGWMYKGDLWVNWIDSLVGNVAQFNTNFTHIYMKWRQIHVED
jgi:hypothetical protein